MQAMNSSRAAGPGHHFPPPTRRTWWSPRSQRLLPGASSPPHGGCTSPCPFALAGTGFPSSRSRVGWGADAHFNFLRAQGQSWGSCLFASMARCSSLCLLQGLARGQPRLAPGSVGLPGDSAGDRTGHGARPPCPSGTGTEGAGCPGLLQAWQGGCPGSPPSSFPLPSQAQPACAAEKPQAVSEQSLCHPSLCSLNKHQMAEPRERSLPKTFAVCLFVSYAPESS